MSFLDNISSFFNKDTIELGEKPLCVDPDSKKALHIYSVKKVKGMNGESISCTDSESGQKFDVYCARFNSHYPDVRIVEADDRDVYFQIPTGSIVRDKELLKQVALKANNMKDKTEFDIARDAGVFERDEGGHWCSTGRYFDSVINPIIDEINHNNYIKVYNEALISRSLHHGNLQNLRGVNLQNPKLEQVREEIVQCNRILKHKILYVGTNILDPNWKLGNNEDRVSGTDFDLWVIMHKNYSEDEKKWFIYEASLFPDRDYIPVEELNQGKHIFFELPEPIQNFIDYHSDAKIELLKLLSQKRIYTSKFPGIIGRVEYDNGRCRSVCTNCLCGEDATNEINQILNQEKAGAEGPSY